MTKAEWVAGFRARLEERGLDPLAARVEVGVVEMMDEDDYLGDSPAERADEVLDDWEVGT